MKHSATNHLWVGLLDEELLHMYHKFLGSMLPMSACVKHLHHTLLHCAGCTCQMSQGFCFNSVFLIVFPFIMMLALSLGDVHL